MVSQTEHKIHAVCFSLSHECRSKSFINSFLWITAHRKRKPDKSLNPTGFMVSLTEHKIHAVCFSLSKVSSVFVCLFFYEKNKTLFVFLLASLSKSHLLSDSIFYILRCFKLWIIWYLLSQKYDSKTMDVITTENCTSKKLTHADASKLKLKAVHSVTIINHHGSLDLFLYKHLWNNYHICTFLGIINTGFVTD